MYEQKNLKYFIFSNVSQSSGILVFKICASVQSTPSYFFKKKSIKKIFHKVIVNSYYNKPYY